MLVSLQACRRLAASLHLPALALALLSCGLSADDAAEDGRVSSVASALDTDGDGLDDGWETTHFGNLSQTGAGDYDADGMTNLEEYTHGFVPTVADGFEDADGDRYPNVFEVRRGSDPNDAGSTPTANYTVNAAGGGTHTTIGAAVGAATTANGAYQIIAVAPGTYTGASNVNFDITSNKPKLLIIGLDGAAKTVIDGQNAYWGWDIFTGAVVSSFTFKNTWLAIATLAPTSEIRLVDLVVRDNANTQFAAGVHVNSVGKLFITGSTFLNNVGTSAYRDIYMGPGQATLTNTVVWGQASGTYVAKHASATLTTSYCLVKDQTLSGTGNLAGTVDPKLRWDGRLRWDSPLRGAGGTVAQSRIDLDGELRPTSAPDIGADQFVDSDADDVADQWEQQQTAGLTTLTSRTQDADSDGLTNEQEYDGDTHPTVADTDGDGLSDGAEVTVHATNPLKADTDGDEMPDGWEVTYGLSPTVSSRLDDADGDGYPNIFEYAGGTNPADIASKPTPTFVVNAAGGGTHTTIGAAVTAASIANGAYQIIGIAPGSYSGASNDVTLTTAKPKFLVIGLEGAGKTFIEGSSWGWMVQNTAVISSLTFRGRYQGVAVNAPGHEVRLVDLVVRDNANGSWPAGLDVIAAAKVSVIGSTFFNNAGPSQHRQMKIDAGNNVTLLNTVLWGSETGTTIAKHASATLTANNSLAKGMTLTGTGNLAGTVDPKLRSDAHVLWDSPLRAAGGAVPQSRLDMDGELRPSSAPDIGADQFVDSDADELADKWELDEAGDLTTLTSRAQDADSDGLANDLEYAAFAKPTVADTDGDGLSDGAEILTHGSNPLSTDTDADDMPDAWEVAHGLSPTVANAFDDADGDRYPNVFEYAGSSDPSSAASLPTPTYTVNAAGGGTHTTIAAAMNAANVANGAYQIIGIAPGTYTGAANLRDVTVASTKPKLLFIGLEGAGKTIIDGELAHFGWVILNSAVVSSLTFRKTRLGIWVEAPAKEVRLVDLVVRDNVAYYNDASGVQIQAAAKAHIVGSTFIDNVGRADGQQIYLTSGATTVANTAVWSSSTGTFLGKWSGATLTASHSFVKGQTLTGTGNLAGTVDPKLRSDARLLWDSPLRAAGGAVAQSRVDIDGELRPSSAPDIGVDQFVDSDADQLADKWELDEAGDLTTLTSRAQDADSDGLANDLEYAAFAKPTVADTDGDGLSDGAEVLTHGSNPLSTDTDADDMPDAWEVAHGLSPTVANAFEDADGDRYPNVFEYAGGTDPSNAASVPAPTYTVNAAGGGTHTTISAAMNAANVANGAYQIIGIAPGTYTGAANLRDVTVASTKPKLLFIGLEGAAKTIIDGELTHFGWVLLNSAVVSSLTFQKTRLGIWVEAPSKEVRLVDLVVRDNVKYYNDAAGVQIQSAAKAYIVGSTFIDNVGRTDGQQIYLTSGVTTVANTLVWSSSTGTFLGKAGGATLTASHSLVKGQTLTGTGNLAGTVDPKLRSDLRLRSDSPLRGAGGAVAQSRVDLDGDLRPSSAPDIGADQYGDVDADGLPDVWEVAHFGNTTAASATSDSDSDGLNELGEYDLETDPLNPDTDVDLVPDGVEITYGLNPLRVDADDIVADLNGDGLIDSLNYQLGYPSSAADTDGDGVSNADEALMCTNPHRADTDGDGVGDDVDAFPRDPLVSALPSNPQDVTPPQITLTAPWYAIEQ